MRGNRGYLLVLVALMLAVGACAPKAIPILAQATPPASPALPTPAAPAVSPEDNAWAGVVEAAKKEGNVTVYSYSLVGDLGLAVSQAFKDRYKISVDIITGRGAEFVERLKTEKRMGRLVADLHDGSVLHATIMKEQRLTLSLATVLPALREKGVWQVDVYANDPAEKHVLAIANYPWSPWVNTKLVKPGEEPANWGDLLAPKWKGKMLLTDPLTSGGPQQYFVPLMREKALDEQFIKALYAQDLRFASSVMEEGMLLARGDRSVSIRGVASQYARFVVEGAPIRAIDMKDGIVIVASPAVVVFEGGPHPNAAKLFVNWLLSPEGQTVWAKTAALNPIRKDVPNYFPEGARLTPQKPVIQTVEDINKATKLFQERWLEKLWDR